jgi:UDP-N-acetylmuramoyl-tripeptide--D-alanyl-D-alanine ligase
VHATEGNLNNQIGVPLTLLATPDDAEAVVVELGTNYPGEIAILAAIAEPEAGIVTSIGEEHLEGFGDLAGVLREEVSLLEGLRPGGVGFVAEEPAALPERAREILGAARVHVAGFGDAADLRSDGGAAGVEVLPDGSTRWRWRGHEVALPLPGRHNVRNALLALGLAAEWGVDEAEAARGLAAVAQPSMRGEWRTVGSLRVLADCYNSNPPSLAAAIELLAPLPANGAERIAIVGTMRELGPGAEALHRAAAEAIAEKLGAGIDRVVATGDFHDAFAPLRVALGERLISDADPLAAYAALAPTLRGGETILLKASRGERLERLIEKLEEEF